MSYQFHHAQGTGRAESIIRDHFGIGNDVELTTKVLEMALNGRVFDWGMGKRVYVAKERPKDFLVMINDAVQCASYEKDRLSDIEIQYRRARLKKELKEKKATNTQGKKARVVVKTPSTSSVKQSKSPIPQSGFVSPMMMRRTQPRVKRPQSSPGPGSYSPSKPGITAPSYSLGSPAKAGGKTRANEGTESFLRAPQPTSLGKRVTSQTLNKPSHAFSKGPREGPLTEADRTPGPGRYRTRHAFGDQVQSRARTAPAIGFSPHSEADLLRPRSVFDTREAETMPGPADYEITPVDAVYAVAPCMPTTSYHVRKRPQTAELRNPHAEGGSLSGGYGPMYSSFQYQPESTSRTVPSFSFGNPTVIPTDEIRSSSDIPGPGRYHYQIDRRGNVGQTRGGYFDVSDRFNGSPVLLKEKVKQRPARAKTPKW